MVPFGKRNFLPSDLSGQKHIHMYSSPALTQNHLQQLLSLIKYCIGGLFYRCPPPPKEVFQRNIHKIFYANHILS